MNEKLRQHQIEKLNEIAENLHKCVKILSKNDGKSLTPNLQDDRDKDEWGYPRRYSENGW